MDVLLTVEQAADFAGVSVQAVRAWHREGKLPEARRSPAKGGHRVRVWFTKGAVESLLRATCPLCGSAYKRTRTRQVYCTDACRKKAHRLKKQRTRARVAAPGRRRSKVSSGNVLKKADAIEQRLQEVNARLDRWRQDMETDACTLPPPGGVE